MDENIYDIILENQNEGLEEIIEEDEESFLLFSINSKKYAVASNYVKELLRDVDVFPLPFVPNYIDGVLNRYGDPYVVIDLALVFNDSKQKNSLFLVFNDDNKISARISDVYDFHQIKSSEIIKFNDDESNKLFIGTFKHGGEDVFIINKDKIIERVEKDFERM